MSNITAEKTEQLFTCPGCLEAKPESQFGAGICTDCFMDFCSNDGCQAHFSTGFEEPTPEALLQEMEGF